MSIKNKIEEVINKHKNGVCFLLGIRPSDLYAGDIQVMANFLTYKAGENHSTEKGAADKSFLDAIKQLPPEKKCEKVLFEACAWKESGELRAKSLEEALRAPPMFSPRVEAALEKRRINTYHKEFESLTIKTALLAHQMRKVKKLIKNTDSFEDPKFREKISKESKKIGHIMSAANYHLKGAMLYAVKSGYTPAQAGKTMHDVYLDTLKRTFNALSAVDDTLEMNGITSNLSTRACNEHEKWKKMIAKCAQPKEGINDEQHHAI